MVKEAVRQILRNHIGRAGLILLTIMILAALLAPLLSSFDPGEQTRDSLLDPSAAHWLGTNQVGQDIWSRLLYGARTSLLVGFGVGGLSLILSVLFGVSAALVGGLYDTILMRIIDAFIIIPMLIVIVLVSAYLQPGLPVIIILLSFLSWQGGARVIRSQTLSLKQRGYIVASQLFGANRWYVAWRHIIPDLGPILFVEFIHGVRRAIFMEAGLAFLGIGDPTMVSWGMMMRNAMKFSYLDVWQWWLVPAGVSLSLTIIGLTFVGHSVESVLDPRLRGEMIA